ncbi:GAF domain-containing SpoIIE family protein phosphatase [Marinigracilibium pacificum]|uniref:PP2C family protein-serine/threonine phosphatase n=1 Tax=Marinigracilibium pacificum TaxID=2729599 RepID=A0A848J298_9BACT|nr:PP2C family protein-serine/threonine phosphatase [Marinigracilibium pacificum]NMM50717.1 PP2C family protein-serine/threonine phosphatase [Marinigracilibium pacificum]
MTDLEKLKSEYDLKELQIQALLEVTQAINENLPEKSLYKIFEFTLRVNLRFSGLALFVNDYVWSIKSSFGVNPPVSGVEPPLKHVNLVSPTFINTERTDFFGQFNWVIPVKHKENLLALLYIKDSTDGVVGDKSEGVFSFTQTLANLLLVAIENKKLARKELKRQAMKRELEIARDVQHYLFPDELRNDDQVVMNAFYLPHQNVGGDYYDYMPLADNNKFIFCIADVSGKGVPAALLMSNFQAALRTLVRRTTDLEEIINDLNFHVFESANGQNFITFFIGLIDLKKDELTYVNCGHNPPMLFCPDGKVLSLDKGTTLLGAFHPLPFLDHGIIESIKGSYLFAYTDGLVEARNDSDEEMGSERVIDIMATNKSYSPEVAHGILINKLDEFRGKQRFPDDITLLSIKIN